MSWIRVNSLRHEGVALLADELGQEPGAKPAFPTDASTLPATEGLSSGPRTRRRPTGAVRVENARVSIVEEVLQLTRITSEDAGRQAIGNVVALGDRRFEAIDASNDHKGHK